MKEILIQIGASIGFLLISWLTERIISFINNKIKNEKLQRYLTTATAAVSSAVKSTYQEFVENLKTTGEFTPERQVEALEMARQKICLELSEQTKAFIEENVGSFEIWMNNAIHSTLYDLKK